MKYGGLWFSEDKATFSSFVVKRFDGQTWKLDLLKSPQPDEIEFFVNKKSLPTVAETSDETSNIVKLSRQAKITAVVSLPRHQSYVDGMLTSLAESLYKGITVEYMNV